MFTQAGQLILKVTRGCNLRCSYCYVLDKDKYDNEVMSDETFNYVIDRYFSETNRGRVPDDIHNIIFDSSKTKNEKKKLLRDITPISVIFHGGEPTKIGKERFSKFCKIITQKARRYKKLVNIGIQTNATMIDEEWADIFHKFGIQPGMSWDGLADASENRGSGDIVLEKMAMLKAHGVQPGIITIAHKGNKDKIWGVLQTLTRLGVSGKINRGVDITTKDLRNSTFELSSDEMIEVAKENLFFMFTHPQFHEDVLFSKLVAWHENISFGDPTKRGAVCYTRYCGAGNNIIEIEPDGGVLFCGRNSVRNEMFTKSVFDKDVLSLKHIRHNWGFQKHKVTSVNERKCNLCSAQSFCDYGCLSFSFQKFEGDLKIDDVTCEYNKKLSLMFSKYRSEILELIKEDVKDEPFADHFM